LCFPVDGFVPPQLRTVCAQLKKGIKDASLSRVLSKNSTSVSKDNTVSESSKEKGDEKSDEKGDEESDEEGDEDDDEQGEESREGGKNIESSKETLVAQLCEEMLIFSNGGGVQLGEHDTYESLFENECFATVASLHTLAEAAKPLFYSMTQPQKVRNKYHQQILLSYKAPQELRGLLPWGGEGAAGHNQILPPQLPVPQNRLWGV
jgi:hypothetical protein